MKRGILMRIILGVFLKRKHILNMQKKVFLFKIRVSAQRKHPWPSSRLRKLTGSCGLGKNLLFILRIMRIFKNKCVQNAGLVNNKSRGMHVCICHFALKCYCTKKINM